MKFSLIKIPFISILFLLICLQKVTAQNNNGQFDDISELSTKITVPFVMPDGIKLMTDIFLPIPQDCLVIEVTIPGFGSNYLEIIPRGKQFVVYDSLNGQPNPNPYQLPMIFSRTPYSKEDLDEAGVISMLGYVFAMQDMRGRYTSEGVYLPIYSDGWKKDPYHPNIKHVLDVLDLSDTLSGNKHEDGYNSIQYILNDLKRYYDLDNNGTYETYDLTVNGRIAMFGGSALGYNQYQAAAARKIDPTQPGLKCLLPIVAPAEFFKSTGYQNGVFRDRLVTGWLKGQIFTGIDDDSLAHDNDIQNTLHTSFDYGLPNKFVAANKAIDHFCSVQYNNGPSGYYPNSKGRPDMDVSRAMVDVNGDGDSTGTISRYTNMEVPAYHLTGWWDIFIDGQIETWDFMRKHLSDAYNNRDLQKLVIGPWAHQTIATTTTGDMTYPENVMDIIGIIDVSEGDIPLSKLLQSEVLSWFRYNMNYHPDQYIGEPKFIIHESDRWQVLIGNMTTGIQVRLPYKNFLIPFEEMLAFMNGTGGLNNFPVEVRETLFGFSISSDTIEFDIPATGSPLIPGLDGDTIKPIPKVDFLNVPNVRFYVVGPNGDSIPENDNVGNYWFSSDTFPIVDDIAWTKMYLHQNSTLDFSAPTTDEGFKIYVHDPDDPVITVGGANMIVRTPQDDRNSQGQMNLADPAFAPYTMNRQGVIQFTSSPIQDSLCIIGFPVATLYAKSNPGGLQNGPTDTDFFIRILDVYPDGREFFVVEGCVNARARDYARNLTEHPEWDNTSPFPNDNTPFTNINIGQIYEYKFMMMPIAYTWGKNHKIKVLISSSNYTRYQVNPNLPIEDGQFFRRKPGDGQKYTFNGVSMSPRTAVQRVAFSGGAGNPYYPTHIDLPVYNPSTTAIDEATGIETTLDALIFPNPANDKISVYMNRNGNYEAKMIDILGQIVFTAEFKNTLSIDVSNFDRGIYFVEITNKNKKDMRLKDKIVKKISVM